MNLFLLYHQKGYTEKKHFTLSGNALETDKWIYRQKKAAPL